MRKLGLLLLAIILMVFVALSITIVSPILIVAEDTTEDASIDMAAKFSLLGYEWVYPGSSVNAQGQTLHNVHIDNPQDPYGAARDIMTYSYNYTPHIIASVNNDAAEAIFGVSIVDDIRANDGYFGYPGNDNVQGSMSRGDAMDAAMSSNGMNIFQVPLQILMGNIRFIYV
ncbi:MAG: hypothetical protein UHW99_06395 [Methanobrevibacter sp.]|uniref:hypothetical protein n=1 Tax=uncultured Methanobrevibacter sp. TaxID=253161 RepID=UPI0025D97676|nr:hypothetical protein [uncultured Methanobrevibacter sp.]MEE1129596.1 hypothetical protein [Methanobrevibacter sp.]